MPTPLRKVIRIGSGGGSSGGGSTGNFGYHVLVPSAGVATIDIGILGGGLTCFVFRLALDATAVSIPVIVWTGGTLVAGLKIWLYLDQDGTGGRLIPTFATGVADGFAADIQDQQIDGTANTRSMYQIQYHGTRWCLDVFTTGMATS